MMTGIRRPRGAGVVRSVALVAVVSVSAAACSDGVTDLPPRPQQQQMQQMQSGGNVVLQWNRAALDAVRGGTLGPPMTARALATVHTVMYDAWSAYDEVATATRFGSELRRPASERTQQNKAEALSYAAYRALVDLFPAHAGAFAALMHEFGYDPANTTVDLARPAGIGNVVAADMLTFRHGDGSNQLAGYADYTGYAPYNTPDEVRDAARWQPLRNPNGSVQAFTVPHWQNVLPFALTSASQFRPPPPPPYASGEYRRQVQEVIDLSAKLTDREKVIVQYWADGPHSEQPPGHWNLFAQLVSQRDGHSLDQDVQLFFALNSALCDASIAAWDAKRAFDYVRPITAIRHLKAGNRIRAWGGPYQGTRTVDGAGWLPYQPTSFITPPFAEYVSGHSTFSAAAAEILLRFTGSDRFGLSVTVVAGSSTIEPGAVPARDIVLSWPTFSAAADEAGMSRRYGGIHFRDGDIQGRILGRRVGVAAWHAAQRHITGAGGMID